MLLGNLGVSLLGNILPDRGLVKADDGIFVK